MSQTSLPDSTNLKKLAQNLRRDRRKYALTLPTGYVREQWRQLTKRLNLGASRFPDIIVHPLPLAGVREQSAIESICSDHSSDLAEYGYIVPPSKVIGLFLQDGKLGYDVFVRGSIRYSKKRGLYFRLDEPSLVHELTHVLEYTLGKPGSLLKKRIPVEKKPRHNRRKA